MRKKCYQGQYLHEELWFKDIVQPKKRGVERGTKTTIRTVLTSYTITDIF
jgi:hypothetical protein